MDAACGCKPSKPTPVAYMPHLENPVAIDLAAAPQQSMQGLLIMAAHEGPPHWCHATPLGRWCLACR